jgi:hypothetical protein
MSAMEWNLEDALRVTREEALEEGIEKGEAETRSYVLELLDKGYSPEEIKKHLTS